MSSHLPYFKNTSQHANSWNVSPVKPDRPGWTKRHLEKEEEEDSNLVRVMEENPPRKCYLCLAESRWQDVCVLALPGLQTSCLLPWDRGWFRCCPATSPAHGDLGTGQVSASSSERKALCLYISHPQNVKALSTSCCRLDTFLVQGHAAFRVR